MLSQSAFISILFIDLTFRASRLIISLSELITPREREREREREEAKNVSITKKAISRANKHGLKGVRVGERLFQLTN